MPPFGGCGVSSNTPWLLRANSDVNLILTGVSVSPSGSKECGSLSSLLTTRARLTRTNSCLFCSRTSARTTSSSQGLPAWPSESPWTEDANRTVLQNLGRSIVKKTVVKISGNEVLSIVDSDVFKCYGDLWKTASERNNEQYRGIDASGNRNTTRIRIDAGNKDETVATDKAIADATAFTSRLISSCSRATCPSTRACWETAWSTNSPSTTTAA